MHYLSSSSVFLGPHPPLAYESRATTSARVAVPAAYLTDWRLTVATSLLRHGRPQKLVAAELGFSTGSSLSRAFKQRFGVAPRAWLEQVAAV
jgi:AraC-like DNA-binding protein